MNYFFVSDLTLQINSLKLHSQSIVWTVSTTVWLEDCSMLSTIFNYSRDLVNRISAAILLPAKSMSCRDRVLRSFPRNKSTNTPSTKNDATFFIKSAAQPLRLILWQCNSVKGTIIIEFWVGSCLGF